MRHPSETGRPPVQHERAEVIVIVAKGARLTDYLAPHGRAVDQEPSRHMPVVRLPERGRRRAVHGVWEFDRRNLTAHVITCLADGGSYRSRAEARGEA
jgi:hypothetical protein